MRASIKCISLDDKLRILVIGLTDGIFVLPIDNSQPSFKSLYYISIN